MRSDILACWLVAEWYTGRTLASCLHGDKIVRSVSYMGGVELWLDVFTVIRLYDQ